MSVVACDAVALVANSVGAVGYDAFCTVTVRVVRVSVLALVANSVGAVGYVAFCTVTVRVVRVSVLALDAVFAIFVYVSNIGSTVQYCFKYCC